MRYQRVLILIAFCAAVYAVYSYVFPTVDVRFRLTVEVQAGGKLYSTSSVVDATWQKTSYFRVAGGPAFVSLRAPCPSIDLGPAGILFIVDALPRLARSKSDMGNGRFLFPHATWLSSLPFVVYPVNPRGPEYALNVLYHKPVSGSLEGKVDVPLDRLPMVVRFRDINDPGSLEELDPRDLSAAYGPDSRVVRATLEMTADQPSPFPPYWPEWIVEDKSPMGLGVAVPVKATDGAIGTAEAFVSISQFKGL